MVNGRTEAEDMAARHGSDAHEQRAILCHPPRWIPVSGWLPAEGVRVLVYDAQLGACEIGYHHADIGWTDSVGDSMLLPTHWMPLPSPPPGEEKP